MWIAAMRQAQSAISWFGNLGFVGIISRGNYMCSYVPSISVSMSISMPISFDYLYLSLSIFLYLSIYLSICLSIYLSIDLSICLSICLSIYRSIYLSIYLSIDLSIYRSIYLSIYLSIDLSIYRSIYLSIYLSICLSVRKQCLATSFLKVKVGSSKRSNSARLVVQKMNVHSISQLQKRSDSTRVPQKIKVDNSKKRSESARLPSNMKSYVLVPMRFAFFPSHLSKVLCRPRISEARSYEYEMLHLSRRNVPRMKCFSHFGFQTRFAPRPRAIFDLSSIQIAPFPPL